MKRKISNGLVALSFLTVPACSGSLFGPSRAEQLSLTDTSASLDSIKIAERAEAEVRGKLNDPDTAKFKEVMVLAPAACAIGKVIGKNAFGAYGGYQDFVWDRGSVIIEGINSNILPATAECLHQQKIALKLAELKGSEYKQITVTTERSKVAYSTLQPIISAAPRMVGLIKYADIDNSNCWIIHFNTGETLFLPSHNAPEALAKFDRMDQSAALLGEYYLSFDMRNPDKFDVKGRG